MLIHIQNFSFVNIIHEEKKFQAPEEVAADEAEAPAEEESSPQWNKRQQIFIRTINSYRNKFIKKILLKRCNQVVQGGTAIQNDMTEYQR